MYTENKDKLLSAEPCEALDAALRALLEESDSVALHGYTPASGLPGFRRALAEDLRARLGVPVSAEGVYVCCGGSAGLASCCRGLLRPGEEALVFAPFPADHGVYVEGAGGVLKVIPHDLRLHPDWAALAAALGEKTALVLLSSPNSLTGAVLDEDELRRLATLLEDAQRRFGHPIYLISDEDCRALSDGALSPLRFYDNAVLCGSFSVSLAMPGERLGYLAVSERMADGDAVFAALAGAARAAGYVNPPSLMQRAVARVLGS